MRIDGTFIRFVANGLFATAVHYTVLTALIEVVHLKYAGVANGIAAIFGITASYLGNKILVFRSTTAHTRTLPRFLLVYFLVALLHAGVLAVWTDYAKLPYTIGFLIATGGSLLSTYAFNRAFVFKPATT